MSAAASLAESFRDLAARFEAAHPGTRVQLNFAASDALLAQITHGAPVDVFASADEVAMDRAKTRGLIDERTRQDFAANTLVVVTPAQRGLPLRGLPDLAGAPVRRVAMGQPAGVPAGRYAHQALEAAGLWRGVSAKAVFAQNVRQALDYAARGEVDAAFVYATDVAAQQGKVRVAFTVASPASLPIRYPIAAVAGSPRPDLARRFIAFVRSTEGQSVLSRHGFRQP